VAPLPEPLIPVPARPPIPMTQSHPMPDEETRARKKQKRLRKNVLNWNLIAARYVWNK